MSQTKETNANQLDSQDVGLIFVREYYTFLNKKPHRLHAFYNKDSLFVRGDEGTITNTAKGQEEIRKKIEECRFEDCKVLVTQVDSQTSANGGILIQVLGEMCNHNGPSQKFSQTFFLAPQPNGFYVLNDIFRFLKDEVEMDYYSCDPTTPPPVRKESPIPLRRIETVIVETPVSPVMYEQRIQEPMMKPVETIVIERADSPVPVVEEKKKKSHGDKASKAEAKAEQKAEAVKAEPKVETKPEPKVEPKVEVKTDTAKAESKVEAKSEPKVEKTESKVDQKTEQKQQQQKQTEKINPPPAQASPKPSAPKTWANLTAAAAAPSPTSTAATPSATPSATPTNTNTTTTTTTTATAVTGNSTTPSTPAVTSTPNTEKTNEKPQNKNQSNRKIIDPTQIFVKLVNESVHEEQLLEAFNKFGTVKSCNIARQRSCAFVEFASPDACQKALAQHKVTLSNGQHVLAEERRYNVGQQNNHQRYQNNRPQNNSFDQRRSNNNRRQNQQNQNTRQQQGKGRGSGNK
ncbi:hypothetical protein EDC96DRAFT_510249 [Choanephora cucurbitarum]|nr:hypothetical protein EDC96DRAFT_510249 [Choanephora cucurbitarum]